MATIPAVGGISSVSLASAGETVILEDAAVRSIDLRSDPGDADGATWAVFAFFFLFLVVGFVLCAGLIVVRLRRHRELAPARMKTLVNAHSRCDDESLPHVA